MKKYYKMLYDESPVSLWIEDFSLVHAYLESLKKEGVKDIRAYFKTYPDRFVGCVRLLRVVDVNEVTLRLYKAASKEEFFSRLEEILRDDAQDSMLESMIAIAEGRTRFEGQAVNYDLKGNPIHLKISWNIPGDTMDDYKRIIVALQDITNLKMVRRKLEESAALFRRIIEQASDGIMLVEKSGKVMLVNRALQEYTGMKASKIVGRYVWNLYEEYQKGLDLVDKPTLTKARLQEIFQEDSEEIHSLSYSYFDKRHKLFARTETIVPIKGDDQDVYAVFLTDFTPVRRTEVITSILHKISHAVNVECSLDELYGTIHKSLSRILDVTNFFIALYDRPSNLITFPYLVDEMGEDAGAVEANDEVSLTAQIISEGRTLLLDEEAIEARVGDRGVVGVKSRNFLGVPLMLSGQVIGAIVLQSYTRNDLYDEEDKLLLESISEHIAYALHKKQADENITVLFQAIEQAGEGIVIFTPDGTIQYVNAIFERILSYRRIELLEKSHVELPFEDSSREEILQIWQRVRSSQPWRGKINMLRKDGSRAILDVAVKPVIDEEGTLSSIIASCNDVTYEIVREEQQKRTQRLEAVGRLTGGIAHDFNNILSAIIGYTELAGDDLAPESDTAQNLGEVLKSANRAKEMISQLLAFSRQEESKTEVINVVEHVRESVRFLRSYLPRTIKIVETYTSEPCNVVAVPGQVHQIIINLGTNAMHVLQREGARLSLNMECVCFSSRDIQVFPELKQCKYMKISVADNGPGIDPAIIDHIFDPYFTTKDANEGTGLGLSIVHSIVQAHEGAIRVESVPGEGATFHIYLPAYTPDVPHQAASGEEKQELPVTGTETIMFVDDEPALVNIFRQGLMRLGYKVEGFLDPRRAYEKFMNDPSHVDILVTDTTMPYMSGVELTERALEIRPDLPVVICTGFTTLISVEEARKRGIKGFVMKPFKIKEIATVIREILDGREPDENRPTTE